MNTKNRLLSLLLFLVIFSGCKKEDDDTSSSDSTDDTEVNTPQDKENITAGFKQIVTCISDYKSGKLIQGVVDFAGISNGESNNDTWVTETVESLINEIAIGTQDQNGDYDMEDASDYQFSINDIKGVYTYNSSLKEFSYANSSASEVVVKLPSSPSGTSNNVVFTFSIV